MPSTVVTPTSARRACRHRPGACIQGDAGSHTRPRHPRPGSRARTNARRRHVSRWMGAPLPFLSPLFYFSLNSSSSCLRDVTYLYSDGHGLPRRIVSRPRRSSRTGHTPQADAVHSLVHARALSFSLSPALYSRCLPKGLGVLRERPPSVKSPVLTRSAHALAAEPHAEGGC